MEPVVIWWIMLFAAYFLWVHFGCSSVCTKKKIHCQSMGDEMLKIIVVNRNAVPLEDYTNLRNNN
jgi:hypothetical protein